MINLIDIYLEAVNPVAGNFRAYTISFGNDLLGDWIVTTTYGRIGTRGTSKNYIFNEPEKAYTHIKSVLKKRFSAQKRIGCNYEIKNCRSSDTSMFSNILKCLTT